MQVNTQADIQTSLQKRDSLFYDGSCPLCSKEIGLMQKHTHKQLNYVDIHQVDLHPQTLDETLPSKELLLKRLHLRRADGEWLIGLDANVYAWSLTTYGKVLGILRWPIIKPTVDFVYNRWADRRYAKRYGCDVCASDTK